ncbi:MAG TPA: nucleoside 2-deoxyribosyltransferase [Streptosporangiaceae bacterium]|nr:nucleoside 2-deoxyribosyltransferase [Streptosporangiaceae bacterium]
MTLIPARKVFLGGPFKSLIDPGTGQMHVRDQELFGALIRRLEDDGCEVHNAHRREGWGAASMTPEECTRLDFTEISRCDVFVAFPGHPASPGTHVEIGWASAMGKPIVLLLNEGCDYAFLIRGLHTVARVTYLAIGEGTDVCAEVSAAVLDLAIEGSSQ